MSSLCCVSELGPLTSFSALFRRQTMAAAQNGNTSGDDEQPRKKRRVLSDSEDEKSAPHRRFSCLRSQSDIRTEPTKSKKPASKSPVASTSKQPAAKVAPIFAQAKTAANGKGKAAAAKKEEEHDEKAKSSSGEESGSGGSDGEISDAEESQAAVQMCALFCFCDG